MESSEDHHGIEQALLNPKQSNGEESISSELEGILSDSSLRGIQRIRQGVQLELGTLFRLAAPACATSLLGNVVSMSTQIFCGHIGNLALAASSLGNNGIQLFAYGLMVTESFILYFRINFVLSCRVLHSNINIDKIYQVLLNKV